MSSQWSLSFKWHGEGAMPDDEVQKLREIVEKAHKQGRLVRFWAAPDKLVSWKTQREAGVDLINTDDLKGARISQCSTAVTLELQEMKLFAFARNKEFQAA